MTGRWIRRQEKCLCIHPPVIFCNKSASKDTVRSNQVLLCWIGMIYNMFINKDGVKNNKYRIKVKGDEA